MVSKRRIQGTIRKVSSGLKGLLAIVGLEGARTGRGSDRVSKVIIKTTAAAAAARCEVASRKDATLLTQLRSGKCIQRLQAYKHLTDDTVDPCYSRGCGQAPQKLEHSLDCSATLQA